MTFSLSHTYTQTHTHTQTQTQTHNTPQAGDQRKPDPRRSRARWEFQRPVRWRLVPRARYSLEASSAKGAARTGKKGGAGGRGRAGGGVSLRCIITSLSASANFLEHLHQNEVPFQGQRYRFLSRTKVRYDVLRSTRLRITLGSGCAFRAQRYFVSGGGSRVLRVKKVMGWGKPRGDVSRSSTELVQYISSI